jgi:hypothetical protein
LTFHKKKYSWRVKKHTNSLNGKYYKITTIKSMKIYYQGEPGSYSHLASKEVLDYLTSEVDDIVGLVDFEGVWEKISA